MWSEVAEVTFDVAYFLPPKPEVELNLVREEGKINISIINHDPEEGEVAAVYNDVYRSIDGEEFKLFMTGVPVNTTITDNTPTVGGNNALLCDSIQRPTVGHTIRYRKCGRSPAWPLLLERRAWLG